MYSLVEQHLNCNKKIKINFNGGDLSSDAGLFLIKEFSHKIDFEKLIKQKFKTNDKSNRFHTDDENLCQKLYQIIAGYFSDDDSDELTNEPVLNAILNKEGLASQPTMSRFFSRMDEDTLAQFEVINQDLRQRIYSINNPEMVLLDLDSTLLATYGKQEGEGFNFHYSSNGYHPLVCYDGLNGDLLKIQLREGAAYSSTGVVDFLQPLLDEYQSIYENTRLYLRGDSGFAVPALFEQAEHNSCSYAIRLKANQNLYRAVKHVEAELDYATKTNKLDYAVCFGEFMYQAKSWNYPRRVVRKVEKPYNQFTYMYTFIVTNMDLEPCQLIQFYCNRGRMENFIKESKSGFNFESMSSHTKIVNENRLQLSMLAYNLFNWFKRLVLPAKMRKMQIDTIRLKLIKIAAKVIHSARYITFKLCSSCPYQEEFYETLDNIRRLYPNLE